MRRALIAACVAAVLLSSLTAPAQDLRALTVQEVSTKGLKRLSEQVVRSKIEIQPGQPYNPAAIARDLRRLHALGHFDRIMVDAAPSANTVALTYIFQEKRIIEEIKIIGNKKLRAAKIRGVLSWKQGDSFAADACDEDRDAVLKLYEEKGFANTTVDINVEEVGPSRVRITYVVTEGKKARIRHIEFENNTALSERKLRKAMKTRRAWWFLGGKYNQDKFEMDLDNIIAEYGDVGHLEADVAGTEIAYSPKGNRMDITISIAEGPQYHVATLEAAQNDVYDDDEIFDIIKVHPGDVHDKSQVAEDADLVARGYHGSGYVNADVTPQVTLDRDAYTTHVVHNIREGELKYIREIDVTGNSVTKEQVVRRELMMTPGERFDGSALKFSQRRLENTEYFDTVRLTLRDIDDSDLYTDVLVDVEEGKTGNFNFGAGYSTDEKLGGFAELRLNNFDISNWPTFSGGGQVFSTRLHLGSVRTRYNLSFTDPEIFGRPLAFGFDVYDESYKYSEGSNYTEELRGGQLRLGKTLSPYVTLRTSLRYTDFDYSDLVQPFFYTREWRREFDPSTTISNTWGIERNTLDYRRDPTTGSKHALVATVAGLGGDNEFIKLEHDWTWYRPMGEQKKWIFSLRTRQGWVNEYGSSDFVPISERFFCGGTSTVRGYKTRDIGPKSRRFWLPWSDEEALGGELRLVNSLEIKYKLNETFRLYSFMDNGGVWRESGDLDLGDVKWSAGVGFGVDVPRMGPIRVDYGIPINPDDDQGNGRLHLVTGFRF